jgi:hypothetical protein
MAVDILLGRCLQRCARIVREQHLVAELGERRGELQHVAGVEGDRLAARQADAVTLIGIQCDFTGSQIPQPCFLIVGGDGYALAAVPGDEQQMGVTARWSV